MSLVREELAGDKQVLDMRGELELIGGLHRHEAAKKVIDKQSCF